MTIFPSPARRYTPSAFQFRIRRKDNLDEAAQLDDQAYFRGNRSIGLFRRLIVAFESDFPVYEGDREKVRRLPFKDSQER
mgnify:FL=1